MLRRLLPRAFAYYTIACVALALVLGEMAFRPERLPVTERQTAAAMASRFGAILEDVSVTASDGAQLQAWFARPDKANGNVVLLLHGVGDNRQGMMPFAETFLAHGYAVLAPDSRAQGSSGGSHPTYGLKEVDDVRRWFDWLKSREHPKCVFALGESMGAAIALQATTTTPFCAVIAESSFASFRQVAYIRVGQVFHVGPWLGRAVLRPAVELGFLYGWLTRGVDLADASPERAVAATRIPILLVHGLADSNIPPEQSERLRARNPKGVTLWEVPNANHCGAVNVAYDEFNKRVLEWFASHGTGS